MDANEILKIKKHHQRAVLALPYSKLANDCGVEVEKKDKTFGHGD